MSSSNSKHNIIIVNEDLIKFIYLSLKTWKFSAYNAKLFYFFNKQFLKPGDNKIIKINLYKAFCCLQVAHFGNWLNHCFVNKAKLEEFNLQ